MQEAPAEPRKFAGFCCYKQGAPPERKIQALNNRSQPFINETKRIEFLFELYDRYTAGLFTKEKKGRTKAK